MYINLLNLSWRKCLFFEEYGAFKTLVMLLLFFRLYLVLYIHYIERKIVSIPKGTNLAALCEHVSSGICGQRRPRSACASSQSDQSLYYPLTESFDTAECINKKQMSR